MMSSLLQLQRSGLELIVPPALKALCEWGCEAPAAALSEHFKEVLTHAGTMLKYAQSNHAAAAENSDLMAAVKYMIRPLQEGREGNRGEEIRSWFLKLAESAELRKSEWQGLVKRYAPAALESLSADTVALDLQRCVVAQDYKKIASDLAFLKERGLTRESSEPFRLALDALEKAQNRG